MIDQHGRKINYLRLAVTDRCNLRCHYCMPENGLNWLPRKDLLTDDEIVRIVKIFSELGVNKLRITGGEPFIRKDFPILLNDISQINGIDNLSITTNGLLTANHMPAMKKAGIKSVNLSLDTLDENRFLKITRRKGLEEVLKTMHLLLENNIEVKLNAVVMENENIQDIIPLVQLAEKLPIDVRFIEEMPFNGGTHQVSLKWNFIQILNYIKSFYPTIQKIKDPENSTSFNYQIPNFSGKIGIIAAYSRSFCGSCNRIRLTPNGILRTCLYDESGFNLKDEMRMGKTDEALKELIQLAVQNKVKDGWEAQNSSQLLPNLRESMATIGG